MGIRHGRLDLPDGDIPEMEDGRGQDGIGPALDHSLDHVPGIARSPGGDNRNIYSLGHGPQELKVIAVARAVPIHGGEQDFPRPPPDRLDGIGDHIQPRVRSTAIGIDPPALARDLFGINGHDNGLGAKGIGAARDVIQNHLLQLLALTAMEEPVSFDAADLRAEKEKVLSAVRVPTDIAKHTARGQYAGGWQGGENVTGFLDEDGMNPKSVSETYAAMRLDINTRRWAGVPFYLRAGKRLGRRVTEIAVVFKRAPQQLFAESQTSALGQNALVIRVQPDEGVTIRFGSKVPGVGMQVRDVTMDFGYGHAFTEASPEAYERLILDVLLGDPPLFPRHEEVELSWKILDPIVSFWEKKGKPEQYRPGTWGPSSADEMMARDGREWRIP